MDMLDEISENKRMTVARRNRLILTIVGFALVTFILYRTMQILYPFVVGFIIAYLVLPLVNLMEKWFLRIIKRRSTARVISILLVYLALLLILALTIFLFLSVVVEQVGRLAAEVPTISRDINQQIQLWLNDRFMPDLLKEYQEKVNRDIRQQIEGQFSVVGQRLLENLFLWFQQGATNVMDVVSKTVSFLLGILIIPIWLFYVLNDSQNITTSLLNLIPQSIREDVQSILQIIDAVFDSFLRGQLILCIIIGIISLAGLFVIGVPYSAVLGIIAAITEAIPMIGPLLGMIPALLIALSQGPESLLFTFILYLVLSQVEAMVLKPRIMGNSLALHPALFMVVLLIGAELGGVVGMILSAPLTAILRDLFKYLYLRFSEQNIPPQQVLIRIGFTDIKLDDV